MMKRLIWNDMKQNKLMSGVTIFFMAVSSMLLALTVLLLSGLTGAIDGLMDRARVPDYMQLHAGTVEEARIAGFVKSFGSELSGAENPGVEKSGDEGIREWQVCRFLNLENSSIALGGRSLADSTQDNGLCVQGERFDYLLDLENNMPQVLPGEVYVPVCYRTLYGLEMGDSMEAGGFRLVIAGFLRDAQMNSMMASSKRFLVNAADYERMRGVGEEEYLIEFLLCEGVDTNTVAQAYAAAGLPANGPAITRPLIRMINTLSDGTMIFVLFLLSIVILLISMLCIRFILLLQMERDRKEVGLLKALGVGKRQVQGLYLTTYLLFSGCGGLAGLLGASLLKRPLSKQLQELYGAASGGFGTACLAVLAVLVTEGIILLSIRRSLKRTERLSAREALFAPQDLDALAGRRRGDRQYGIIGVVAAACTLLVLVPQNLYSTMSAPEFVTYMGIGDSDIRMDVRGSEDIDEVTQKLLFALSQDTQVEAYAGLRTKACPAVLADGRTVGLSVEIGDHHVFPVSCQKGALPKKPGELALSALNSEELGITVGDSLELVLNGKGVEYTVCGIYSDITNGGKTAKAASVDDDGPAMWSVVYVSLREDGKAYRNIYDISQGEGEITKSWEEQRVGEGGAGVGESGREPGEVDQKERKDTEAWMEQYRQPGVEVTDLEDYVKDTYGQTLEQLRLAATVVAAISMLVIFAVVMLFMRLIVEKNRCEISLHKALGFTGASMRHCYFIRGILPVAAGAAAGFFAGNLFGESLCGLVLRAFGAEGFRFVISWGQVLTRIPAIVFAPAVLAVLAGIGEIGKIRASECCTGRE